MWKLLYESVRGTSHERCEQPCQDAAFGGLTRNGEEAVLVVACADGAGSAALADTGAGIACQTITRLIFDACEQGFAIAGIEEALALQWYQEVRARLEAEAAQRGVDVRELACTLLTAVVGQSAAVFAQVGDGEIVTFEDEEYRTVFWPQRGEYANTTHFLTSSDFIQALEFRRHDGVIEELALMTDGLQMLALDYARRQAHGPFFRPLFLQLRNAPSTEDLIVPLREFLNSPRVNERTDDDKSLILASRRLPDVQPSPV
jgi:hypothetical protein